MRDGDPIDQRLSMVDRQLRARGIVDDEVLRAIEAVPREAFVAPSEAARAYADSALPIGGGQTISQPYIVARMTEALRLGEWRRDHPEPAVLDVGTGSGYQAAILAQLGARVTSIERDPELASAARDRLEQLGLSVTIIIGDGSVGWPQHAPYAGIIVAAAAPAAPPPLVSQLAIGGRLVIPIGDRHHQLLTVITRSGDGISQATIEPCVFVPLVGRHGFPD